MSPFWQTQAARFLSHAYDSMRLQGYLKTQDQIEQRRALLTVTPLGKSRGDVLRLIDDVKEAYEKRNLSGWKAVSTLLDCASHLPAEQRQPTVRTALDIIYYDRQIGNRFSYLPPTGAGYYLTGLGHVRYCLRLLPEVDRIEPIKEALRENVARCRQDNESIFTENEQAVVELAAASDQPALYNYAAQLVVTDVAAGGADPAEALNIQIQHLYRHPKTKGGVRI